MIGNMFIKALYAKYNAQKEEALATLTLYLNNPSAVADHSAILDEIDSLLQKLSHAELAIRTLDENIRIQKPQEQPKND